MKRLLAPITLSLAGGLLLGAPVLADCGMDHSKRSTSHHGTHHGTQLENSGDIPINQANVQRADLPVDARAGECFARVWMPPGFESRAETVLVREADERIEIIPTRYETVTEQVLVKPTSEKLVEVPAQYGWEEESILVEPASTEWRESDCNAKGAIPNATGECMCLVENAARYETVRRRVMVSRPTTRSVTVPAEYRTVQKTVMASPARERRIAIAAEYATIMKKQKVRDGEMVWVKVACDPNRAYSLNARDTRLLQRSLQSAGYDPGPVDGVFGSQTQNALITYQRDNGLALGACDAQTLSSLNVR